MSDLDRQRIIFLIEDDDETRPLLRGNLQREGYRVLVAIDEDDAFERVSGKRIIADLVLLNLVGKSPEEALLIGRRIREHAEFDGRIPLIIIAEKYGPELEGTDVNVSGNDWITYPEDHEQLQALMERLLAETPR